MQIFKLGECGIAEVIGQSQELTNALFKGFGCDGKT